MRSTCSDDPIPMFQKRGEATTLSSGGSCMRGNGALVTRWEGENDWNGVVCGFCSDLGLLGDGDM